MLTLDILSPELAAPRRGDLLQTFLGNQRERTWIVLRARHMKRSRYARRYQVWAARWWELEPELRVRLERSATRNGPGAAGDLHEALSGEAPEEGPIRFRTTRTEGIMKRMLQFTEAVVFTAATLALFGAGFCLVVIASVDGSER